MPAQRLFLALIVFLPLSAQTPAADLPTIRVTTRLVDVTVVARDKNGPAVGLTADDFQVYDNGEERKIAFFSVSTVRPPARIASSPNVFTNRSDRRADAAGRLTIILIDSFNAAFEDQAKARKSLMKYIAEVQPRDRMAICAMGTSIRMIHDFTNDRDELQNAVEKYWPSIWLVPDVKTAAQKAMIGLPGGSEAGDATDEAMMSAYRGRVSSDLMKELAERLAQVPGRKNLIWLSTGFPVRLLFSGPRQEFLPVEDLALTGRALAKGNVAVYPVDTAGLTTGGGGGITNPGPGGGNRHYAMNMLAELTGGRAFYDRNDIDQEVREAVDDSEVTYTLGFYPTAAEQDGSYHSVRVDVSRPGVELRHRQGYVAADPQIAASELDGRDQIRNALVTPIESTGITLNVRLEKPNPAKPNDMRMTIGIPLSDITLKEQENGWLGTLDLVVSERAADGREVVTYGDPVVVNPNRQRYETLRKEGLLLRREIAMRGAVSSVRIVVFDRGSGRLGSIEIPVRKQAAGAPVKSLR